METPKEFLEGYDPQIKEVGYDNYAYTPQQVIDRLELYRRQLVKDSGISWTDSDIDAAYLMGVMNAGSFDDLNKELNRLKDMGLKPHEAVANVLGK